MVPPGTVLGAVGPGRTLPAGSCRCRSQQRAGSPGRSSGPDVHPCDSPAVQSNGQSQFLLGETCQIRVCSLPLMCKNQEAFSPVTSYLTVSQALNGLECLLSVKPRKALALTVTLVSPSAF